ncbi:MAG: ABC transporter permease [Anaerolineae bacterium]
MNSTLLVGKHEIKTTLTKRSFWLTTFLFPLLIMAFTVLPQIMTNDAMTSGGTAGAASPVTGYVDQAGVIQQLPPDVPSDALRAFPTEEAAQSALAAGDIGRYYLIPADFVKSGDVVLVESQFSPMSSNAGNDRLTYVVDYNLAGSRQLASLLVNPTPSEDQRSLSTRPATNAAQESALGFTVSFAVMFILFFTITMSSSYMLQSVAKEKENRTAEVLLLSLRPRELMLGKVLGLGLVALVQMGVWMGGGSLLLNRGESLLAGMGGYSLPPGFFVWALIYFLLGYLVYSSALGALGALAPNVREGSQFTFVFLLPLLVPLWLNSVFIDAPSGTAATLLSLFPLTAPTSMVTRLSVGSVPLWQLVLGVVLLAVTAYLFVMLAARFFRADTLLSSNSLDWRRLIGELQQAAVNHAT